jgi:hypothetical protein
MPWVRFGQKEEMPMEELLQLAQTYRWILAAGAAALMGLVLMTYLSRILRQIKRLNKSLGSISENMQAYMDVVLSEEEETEEEARVQAGQPRNMEPVQKAPLSEEQKRMEDEKLFNSVLQEYFS